MIIELVDRAIEEGTYAITLAFTDDEGDAVAPNVLTWTLTDLAGNIINDRDAVNVPTPEASETVVLTGDDLVITNRRERVRLLLVEGTYDSSLGAGLPLRESVSFIIEDIVEPVELTIPTGLTLIEIRNWFVEVTRRGDLSYDDGSDNGANKYINAGVRLLDTLYNHQKKPVRFVASLAQGVYVLNIPLCRSILEVWVADSAGDKVYLKKKDLAWMRKEYAGEFSDVDTGTPIYYSPNIIGLGPTQIDSTSSDFSSNKDVGDLALPTRSYLEYNGILIMPPCDDAYTCNVFGNFSQVELEADNDQNFWSVMYPFCLVTAAKFCLESGFYPERARKVLENLHPMLTALDYDIVEEEVAGIDQMEG